MRYTLKNFTIDLIVKNKLFIGVVFFCGIFQALSLPLKPYLLGVIIDKVKNINFESQSVIEIMWFPIGAFIVLNVFVSINEYFAYTIFWKEISKIKSKIHYNMFYYLTGQSYSYFENKHSGFLTNKITNVITSLDQLLNLVIGLYPQILTIIISGVFMVVISPMLSLIFWIWACGMIFYTYKSALILEGLSKKRAESGSCLNGSIVDCVSNINNVICSATRKHESIEIQGKIHDAAKAECSLGSYYTKVRIIQGVFTSIFLAFTLVGLVYLYYKKLVSIGDFAFIITLLFQMIIQIGYIGLNLVDFFKSMGNLREGLGLMQDEYVVADTASAKSHQINQGSISIKNITFHYSENKLFENLSLTVKPGEKIGIVGRSGGGKTTLIKLLLRLYDVNAGTIKIDNIDIKDYTLESLRSQIALVPQDLQLFHRTIYDNIAYGCGLVSEDQVIEASRKAACHEFILELPEQYNTLVGERGVKLSGGQRQRVAIARAFLKNAPILLLDEATSALDSETEYLIQKSLNLLLQNRTAIIVAHRLSTLKKVDKIIVMEYGKIIEAGTHEELIVSDGIYSKLWNHQSNLKEPVRTIDELARYWVTES